ncbi:hypothetical protein ACFLQM_00040 [Acidobacteriota bacterium]
MRHRLSIIVVVLVVVISLFVFAGPTASQVTVQQHVSSSQQQNADRIRNLMQEIRELMSQLSADAQVTLERELGICEPATFSAINVGPIDDSRLGDVATSGGATVMVLGVRGVLNFDGRATIRVNGTPRELRWNLPGRGNGYLMVDASAVRVARFELFSADGRPIRGLVLVSDGVRLKTPDGRTLAINDPWVLLNHFDSDGDARLAPNDSVWRHLKVFLDENGDGRVAAAEIRTPEDQNIRRINLDWDSPSTGSSGIVVTRGTYTGRREELGLMAAVTLPCP